MSLPVPLGVRFYQINSAMDRWVTSWVDDVSFRSVAPGGFASATITLRIPRGMGSVADPDPLGFSRLSELFVRIQIVDLRTMEVAWEGRVEDPARQTEPDVWTIGALGSMVAATDIERPVWYVSSGLDGWAGGVWNSTGDIVGINPEFWENSAEEATNQLKTSMRDSFIWVANERFYFWRFQTWAYNQPIARFTTTHNSWGPGAEDQNFSIVIGIPPDMQIDVTGVETGTAQTKTNLIPTDYTAQNVHEIFAGLRRDSGTANYAMGSELWQLRVINPKAQALRRDRFGNKLVGASDYTHGDFVTVSMVVEDVVGRLLVGGWRESAMDTPWPGSVRPSDAYIDTSDTTQIQNLMWPDGTTAAAILNELIEQVQPGAYWGIWESAWGAGNADEDFGVRHGFRFAFETWPDNWGYLATSADGFEGQPNGADLHNFAFYRHRDSGDGDSWSVVLAWLGDEMAPELYDGGITRAVTITKEDPVSGATAASLGTAYLQDHSRALNAGTLTVKRPIYFYDDGSNSWSGGARMLDPWMIRPGKLIRITDLPPRTMINDVRPLPNLPNPGTDGTIFKVVACEYSSADNSCRLELDQLRRWELSTQIKKAAPSGIPVTIVK